MLMQKGYFAIIKKPYTCWKSSVSWANKAYQDGLSYNSQEDSRRRIKTTHVQTENKIANILTKPLCSSMFHAHLRKLGVIDIHTPTWGGVLKERRLIDEAN